MANDEMPDWPTPTPEESSWVRWLLAPSWNDYRLERVARPEGMVLRPVAVVDELERRAQLAAPFRQPHSDQHDRHGEFGWDGFTLTVRHPAALADLPWSMHLGSALQYMSVAVAASLPRYGGAQRRSLDRSTMTVPTWAESMAANVRQAGMGRSPAGIPLPVNMFAKVTSDLYVWHTEAGWALASPRSVTEIRQRARRARGLAGQLRDTTCVAFPTLASLLGAVGADPFGFLLLNSGLITALSPWLGEHVPSRTDVLAGRIDDSKWSSAAREPAPALAIPTAASRAADTGQAVAPLPIADNAVTYEDRSHVVDQTTSVEFDAWRRRYADEEVPDVDHVEGLPDGWRVAARFDSNDPVFGLRVYMLRTPYGWVAASDRMGPEGRTDLTLMRGRQTVGEAASGVMDVLHAHRGVGRSIATQMQRWLASVLPDDEAGRAYRLLAGLNPTIPLDDARFFDPMFEPALA